MAKEYGKDWRVEVGTGVTPEVFKTIGGEVSFDWSRSSKEIDESSKDDGTYSSTGFGQQSVSISMNGKLSLPDAGLERVSAVSKTQPPITPFRITRKGVTKFEGKMSVGNFSTTHPNDEVCTYKFDLRNNGAPTTDTLGGV